MTEGDVYRCFMALEVSQGIRRRVQELQSRLNAADAELRFSRPEDLHLTLVFLGATPVAEVSRVAELMDGVARFHAPFTYTAAGVSVFGPPGRPRVIWGGIKPCPPLLRLQKVLTEGVARLGHPVEERPFEPHLTLARVQTIGNDRSLTSLLASITDSAIGEQNVTRLVLMRSGLESATSRYSYLHASPLKGS
jgi:2'-5' RNA ligase